MVSGVALGQTGDVHQSEDLAQETFLLAWQKLAELTDVRKFPGWLCSIARNLARNALRKKTEQTGTPLEVESKNTDPSLPLVLAEQNALIAAALQNIPENYREPLVLFYRGEQSVKQIADALEITEETTRQRLSRARKFLRREIEQAIGRAIADTAPGDMFTMTVMASVGTAMLVTTAQAAVVGTGTATVGTSGVTGGTATGTTSGLAAFWTFAGSFAVFLWIFSMFFVFAWTYVRNAPTLNARRYRLHSFFSGMRLFPVLYIALMTVMFGMIFFIPKIASVFGIDIPFTFPFPVILILLIPLIVLPNNIRLQKKFKKVVESDLGIAETPVKSYSYTEVIRCIHSALFVNILFTITAFAFVLILPITDGSITLTYTLVSVGIAAFICLAFYGFYRFGLFLLESCCRDGSCMQNTPPLVDKRMF